MLVLELDKLSARRSMVGLQSGAHIGARDVRETFTLRNHRLAMNNCLGGNDISPGESASKNRLAFKARSGNKALVDLSSGSTQSSHLEQGLISVSQSLPLDGLGLRGDFVRVANFIW